MSLTYPFPHADFGDLFDSLFPDFILAFAFFTSIVYAVLSRRFNQQRAAGLAAGAVGLALAAGLTWWEYENGFSVRDLGPIAVGFAVLLLGGVIFTSIQYTGGSLAGVGIGIGASLIIGWVLGLDWHVREEIVQSVISAALILGILSFLLHHHRVHCIAGYREPVGIRHDMHNLYEPRHVSHRLLNGFRGLKNKASELHKHPHDAEQIVLQIKRMRPAEGWLTERMARLREKAVLLRKGHLTRIQELGSGINDLPPEAREQAVQELERRFYELKLDKRIERLDHAVAETELRIRNLSQQAVVHARKHDHPALLRCLETATRLQKHNEHLFKIIDRTERKLLHTAQQATWSARKTVHPPAP